MLFLQMKSGARTHPGHLFKKRGRKVCFEGVGTPSSILISNNIYWVNPLDPPILGESS
jgi:hypothetical protein